MGQGRHLNQKWIWISLINGFCDIHMRAISQDILLISICTMNLTRTRWRRVKTLGQHQVGVNLQSHAQHQLWISTWHIFHEFHKIMPSLSYPVSLVNQNVILVNISHWRLHMAWIMYVLNEHLDFMPTWHICNIISDNIVIQLIWKFQESNWNPDWFIALMDSFDTNYIFTNNKKSWPIWPKFNTIPDNAMLQLSWKFG